MKTEQGSDVRRGSYGDVGDLNNAATAVPAVRYSRGYEPGVAEATDIAGLTGSDMSGATATFVRRVPDTVWTPDLEHNVDGAGLATAPLPIDHGAAERRVSLRPQVPVGEDTQGDPQLRHFDIVHGDAVVGDVLLAPSVTDPKAGVLYFNVKENEQGHGYGTDAIGDATEIAFSEGGFGSVRSIVEVDNFPARIALRRNGYDLEPPAEGSRYVTFTKTQEVPAEVLPPELKADVSDHKAPKWQPDFAKLAAGDPDTLSRVMDEYGGSFYRRALGILKNPEDAEEVVLETLTKAWQGAGSLAEDSKFGAWADRICRNTAISRLRKITGPRDHEDLTPVDEMPDVARGSEHHGMSVDPSRNPGEQQLGEETAYAAVLRERLGKAGFTEDRATIMVMDLLGYSDTEIAESLNKKVGTVKSNLSRAKRDLRNIAGGDGAAMVFGDPEAANAHAQRYRRKELSTAAGADIAS